MKSTTMESDARRERIINGFFGKYNNIIISNELFSINKLIDRHPDTCHEFLNAVLDMLSSKKFNVNTAANIIAILFLSLNDNSNFDEKLNSFVYEVCNSLNGNISYWNIILEVENENLKLYIEELPSDPDERIAISWVIYTFLGADN